MTRRLPVGRRLNPLSWVACLSLLAAGTVATSAAIADHVDSMYKTPRYDPDCFDSSLGNRVLCQTDNSRLTAYRQRSVGSSGSRQIRSTLVNSYNTTDLAVRFTRPSYEGDSETDIIYRVRNVPGEAIGATHCNDAVSDTRCDQHYVTFDDQPGRALACHETGHAVGLLHPTEADPPRGRRSSRFRCMTNSPGSTALGPHNASEIDSTY